MKDWRFVGNSINNKLVETNDKTYEAIDIKKKTGEVFKFGSRVRTELGFLALSGDRIAVCVIRGKT